MPQKSQDSSFAIKNTTKGKPPGLPFRLIKNKVLGADYELSLVFVGRKRIRTLNRIYRNKDKPTDILSFSVSKKSGEIFICRDVARVKAKSFSKTASDYVAFLFIHGLLHLKGMDHGSRMEREEKSIGSYFGI